MTPLLETILAALDTPLGRLIPGVGLVVFVLRLVLPLLANPNTPSELAAALVLFAEETIRNGGRLTLERQRQIGREIARLQAEFGEGV